MNRVDDMPVMAERQAKIDAPLYNLWRRSQHKIHYPIRFNLEGFSGLVMILEQEVWIVADERQYDLPIVCWCTFEDKGRDAIHTPVPCTIKYFHFAATRVSGPALRLMQQELQQRMDKLDSPN